MHTVWAVLERDFVAEGTRPRAFAIRGFAASAIAIAVAAGILTSAWKTGYLDPRTFERGAWVLVVATVFLAPILTADSILAEREGGTLPLVLSSPVGGPGFVLGKLLSRAGLLLALLACAAPVLGACTLLDGEGPGRIADLAVLLAAVCLEIVSLGLWASATLRGPGAAAAVTMLLAAGRWFGTLRAGEWIEATFLPSSRLPGWAAIGATPLAPLLGGGALPSVPPDPLPAGALGGFGPFLLHRPERLYLLGAVLLAAATVLLLGRVLPAISFPRPARRPSGDSAKGRLREPGALLAWNPVLWRERVRMRRPRAMALLVLVGVGWVTATMLFLGGEAPAKAPAALVTFLAMSVTAVCAITALEGATLLARDRTDGTLIDLRLTRLPPGRILAGKVLAAAPIPLLGLLCTVTVAYQGAAHLPGLSKPLIGAMVLAVLLPAAWGVLGIAWGLAAPTRGAALAGVAAAFVISFLGFGVWALVPFLILASDPIEERAPRGFVACIAIPALFLGPPVLVLPMAVRLLASGPILAPLGGRLEMYEVIFTVVWVLAGTLFLVLRGLEIPALFRAALEREEAPPTSPRHHPTIGEWIEKRRLARAARLRARQAAGTPGVPPA